MPRVRELGIAPVSKQWTCLTHTFSDIMNPRFGGGDMVTERRLPQWLKVKMPGSEGYRQIKDLLEGAQLNTVCAEAQCPNIGECWDRGTATFMILGDICTRACAYCAVDTGKPEGIDCWSLSVWQTRSSRWAYAMP